MKKIAFEIKNKIKKGVFLFFFACVSLGISAQAQGTYYFWINGNNNGVFNDPANWFSVNVSLVPGATEPLGSTAFFSTIHSYTAGTIHPGDSCSACVFSVVPSYGAAGTRLIFDKNAINRYGGNGSATSQDCNFATLASIPSFTNGVRQFQIIVVDSGYTGVINASSLDSISVVSSFKMHGGTIQTPSVQLRLVGNPRVANNSIISASLAAQISGASPTITILQDSRFVGTSLLDANYPNVTVKFQLNSSTSTFAFGTSPQIYHALFVGIGSFGSKYFGFNNTGGVTGGIGTFANITAFTCAKLTYSTNSYPICFSNGSITVTETLDLSAYSTTSTISGASNSNGVILIGGNSGTGSKTILGTSSPSSQCAIGTLVFDTPDNVNMSGNLTLRRGTTGTTPGEWSVRQIGAGSTYSANVIAPFGLDVTSLTGYTAVLRNVDASGGNGLRLITSGSFSNTSVEFLPNSVVNAAALTINGGGTLTLNNSVLNVTGNTSINNGLTNSRFALNNSTTSVGGTITINSGSDLTLNNSIVSVRGNISNNSIITNTNSTLVMNGVSTQSLYGNGNYTISSFQVSNSTSSVVLQKSLTVLGSANIASGSNLFVNTGTLNIQGNLTNNGVVTLTTSAVRGPLTVGGDIINNGTITDNKSRILLNGSGVQAISGTNGFSITTLHINGTGTKTLQRQVTILDSLKISAGVLSVGAGNLIFAATPSLTARIAQITGGGSITGSITAKVYEPGGNTGWTLMGSNGVNGATINKWSGYGGAAPHQFPASCWGCQTYPSQNYGFTSIQGWNESAPTLTAAFVTASAVVNGSTALTPGKGFWVYLGSSSSTTTPYTLSLTNVPVQGQVTVGLTNTPGAEPGTVKSWNLVANPYASPISWSKVRAANSLGGTAAYVWNTDSYSYIAYTGLGAAGSTANVIPAGQGFFVEAPASAVSTLTFNESMKTTYNTSANPLQRTQASNESFFSLSIRDIYGSFDEAIIGTHSDASRDYDPMYDAHKRYSTPNYQASGVYTKYTDIATLANSKDTCFMNFYPPLGRDIVIPVLVHGTATGEYTIALNQVENFPNCIMLRDKVEGLYHDIKMSNYVFHMADTTSAPRFELLLCRDFNVDQDVSVHELNAKNNNIFIIQDENGAIVNTFFEQTTTAKISVYNILGQQLVNDQIVKGTETSTRINLNTHNQVLIIKVSTDKEVVTKKMVLR